MSTLGFWKPQPVVVFSRQTTIYGRIVIHRGDSPPLLPSPITACGCIPGIRGILCTPPAPSPITACGCIAGIRGILCPPLLPSPITACGCIPGIRGILCTPALPYRLTAGARIVYPPELYRPLLVYSIHTPCALPARGLWIYSRYLWYSIHTPLALPAHGL
jgi:hypothetical protein